MSGTIAGTALAGAVASQVVGGMMAPSSSGGGSLVSNAAGVVGGALSIQEAQAMGQDAATAANPFGQYNAQFGSQLASGGYPAQAQATGNAGQAGQNAIANQFSTLGQQAAGQGNINVTNQYQQMLTDPNAIFGNATYQAETAQGTEALNRTLAKQGQTGSGAQMAALQDYGTSNAAAYQNQIMGQLSTAFGQQNTQAATMIGEQQSALTGQSNALTAGTNQAQTGNSAAYNELSQMSGLSGADQGAAAKAMAGIYGNVNTAAQGLGSSISGLANNLGGGIGNAVGNYISSQNATSNFDQNGNYIPASNTSSTDLSSYQATIAPTDVNNYGGGGY